MTVTLVTAVTLIKNNMIFVTVRGLQAVTAVTVYNNYIMTLLPLLPEENVSGNRKNIALSMLLPALPPLPQFYMA